MFKGKLFSKAKTRKHLQIFDKDKLCYMYFQMDTAMKMYTATHNDG